jgi:tight adherence protein B
MNRQELFNTVVMASVFVLVFSAWTICVLLWLVQYSRRRKQLQQRMGVVDPVTRRVEALRLWREDQHVRRAGRKQQKETLASRLERLRQAAGWKTPAHIVLLAVSGMAVLAGIVVFALGYGLWLGVSAALCIAVAFRMMTQQRISARIAKFERQFVDSLRIAARALRAGHPLAGAFHAIAEEIDDPVGAIFSEICQEQTLGRDLQESIRRVADNAQNTDLKLFATAVSIQMTTGGNLAEVMESLAAVMRSRMRLNRRVRVLTSSTRMNKNTLLSVPVLLFLFLNIKSPEYVGVMYSTSVGRALLIGTVVSMLFGAWVMGRLSKIRY